MSYITASMTSITVSGEEKWDLVLRFFNKKYFLCIQ